MKYEPTYSAKATATILNKRESSRRLSPRSSTDSAGCESIFTIFNIGSSLLLLLRRDLRIPSAVVFKADPSDELTAEPISA